MKIKLNMHDVLDGIDVENIVVTIVHDKGKVITMHYDKDSYEIEEEPKTVAFNDLSVGDYFKGIISEDMYMKVSDFGGEVNAICFDSHDVWTFKKDTEVIPVKCKLEVLEDEA